MVVAASDLKTKGVQVFDNLLRSFDEVLISVRGKKKYVVVDIDRYEHLRELELEHALKEVHTEIAAGKSRVMTAQEHLDELERALRD